jgi:hypothetical protein
MLASFSDKCSLFSGSHRFMDSGGQSLDQSATLHTQPVAAVRRHGMAAVRHRRAHAQSHRARRSARSVVLPVPRPRTRRPPVPAVPVHRTLRVQRRRCPRNTWRLGRRNPPRRLPGQSRTYLCAPNRTVRTSPHDRTRRHTIHTRTWLPSSPAIPKRRLISLRTRNIRYCAP